MPNFTRLEQHPQEKPRSLERLEKEHLRSREQETPLKAESETRIWCVPQRDGTRHFHKEYRIPGSRRLFSGAARSRASREFRALLAMDLAGLPVARPLWYGEVKHGPILECSVLVTRCLGAKAPLPDWLRGEPAPQVAVELCRDLGALARNLHDLGFGHFRMQAKNFMVCEEGVKDEANHGTTDPVPTLHMIDAPYTCRWAGPAPDRIRAVDLEDLCGSHAVFTADQVEAVMDGYRGEGSPSGSLDGYHPGSRSRWGQKLRRIAYYLGAIWSGHRP